MDDAGKENVVDDAGKENVVDDAGKENEVDDSQFNLVSDAVEILAEVYELEPETLKTEEKLKLKRNLKDAVCSVIR